MKIFLTVLFLIGNLTSAWAETIYDKPYMADFPWKPPTHEIVEFIKQSDVIFVGVSETFEPSYHGRIKPIEIIKGKLDTTVNLSWQPSATGIAQGSRHLFFVKREGTGWIVIKEMYIHQEPYDAIRAYGAMDGGRELTLSVVKFLSGQNISSNQLSELLFKETKHEHNQRRDTALLLAIELSSQESIPALKYLIENDGDARAVYGFVKLDAELGIKSTLKYLAEHLDIRREQQAPIFAALAYANNPKIVESLAAFGSAHPEFQVSCAFVMAQLGTDEAIPIIEQWKGDPKSKTIKEKVSTGWQEDILRSELLDKALTLLRMKTVRN